MAYRSNPQYYRSWNVLALGLKTEVPEEPNKIDASLSKDRQRPRRESWSQPPQRGRGPSRGRGTWYIDNRPQNRRRNTMPDSDYSYHTNDETNDYNQLEDNPILEEPRNLSVSPESDYNDFKIKESDGEKCDYQDETPSWDRKQNYPPDNFYRPPRSRSASFHWKSNSSSDDGSQSRGYSNGSSKKHEPNYKTQRKNSWEREPEPDQTWVHDKFEYPDSDSDQKYKKDKKDASTQVTPIDINNELKKNNTKNITACEFSKKINKPESPKDQANPAELPKEITIKFSELMKESNDEKPESPQKLDSKNDELVIEPEVASETKFEEVLPEVTPEITPEVEVTPEVTSEAEVILKATPPEAEVTPEVTPEAEVTPEVTPEAEVTPEVTPEAEVTPEVTPEAEVTPEVTPEAEVTPEVTPEAEVTPEVTPEAEITPEVTSEAEVTPKATSEVTPEAEVTPEVIPASPKEEELQIQILINLDEDNNTSIQPIQPKISEDIYALDWASYQKTLMEEEIRLTMKQPTKMPTPRKLDTGLKDFDSL